MQQHTAVYWFRNDLRLSDNPALQLACQQSAIHAALFLTNKRNGKVGGASAAA